MGLVWATAFFSRRASAVRLSATPLRLLFGPGDRAVASALAADPHHEDGVSMHGGAGNDCAFGLTEVAGGREPEPHWCVWHLLNLESQERLRCPLTGTHFTTKEGRIVESFGRRTQSETECYPRPCPRSEPAESPSRISMVWRTASKCRHPPCSRQEPPPSLRSVNRAGRRRAHPERDPPHRSPAPSDHPRRSAEGHRAVVADAECQSEGGDGEAILAAEPVQMSKSSSRAE